MIAKLALTVALLAPAQLPPVPPVLPPLPPLPPVPPPPCLVPPCPVPEPPPPPPSDDPPTYPPTAVLTAKKEGRYVFLDWPRARDDLAVWGYRIYRDGNIVARKPATITKARLALPCGRHRYRVEVVDSTLQTASLSRRVRRVCGS